MLYVSLQDPSEADIAFYYSMEHSSSVFTNLGIPIRRNLMIRMRSILFSQELGSSCTAIIASCSNPVKHYLFQRAMCIDPRILVMTLPLGFCSMDLQKPQS